MLGSSWARMRPPLIRLWQEKRGEVEPEDLSDNLIVQLGVVTEDLNRRWYEARTGLAVRDVQRRTHHPVLKWMAATLDGVVDSSGAVFKSKFMLPWSFSEEGAAEKCMAQLQHNMWVIQSRSAVLSIITGGGKWVELTVAADALYQHVLPRGREEIPPVRGDRRAPVAVWRRGTPARPSGGARCRYERLERLGGVRGSLLPDAPALRRARDSQERAEAAHAG